MGIGDGCLIHFAIAKSGKLGYTAEMNNNEISISWNNKGLFLTPVSLIHSWTKSFRTASLWNIAHLYGKRKNQCLQTVEMLLSLLLTCLGQSFRQMWECNLTLCLEGTELEYWRSCKYTHIPFLHHSLILGVKVRWSYSYIGTNYNCQKAGLKTPITVSSISITTCCCFLHYILAQHAIHVKEKTSVFAIQSNMKLQKRQKPHDHLNRCRKSLWQNSTSIHNKNTYQSVYRGSMSQHNNSCLWQTHNQ